jgi:Fe-S-cluster containining protein
MSYGVDIRESSLQGPMVSLQVLYDGMPKTSGCDQCPEINGENKDWCCLSQNPSMYYVEFLKVYETVEKWDRAKRKELILRALRNYLDNSLNKGCIFYDKGCQVYAERPFGCRMYGVIPKENWDKRWELLKERQGDTFEAKPQCPLVTADKQISPENEDRWFLNTRQCEDRIGVTREVIDLHDLAGG